MSNMTENQRAQFERATYAGTGERIRRGSERGVAIYNVIAIALGAVLAYAAISAIDNGWQWVVLGVIVMTTIGFMIAVNPARRA
jgi:hypothetical protein